MTAPPGIYPYEPRFHFEPPDLPDIQLPNKTPPPNWPLPFIPNFRGLPSGVKPTVDGYPWWVEPPGFLNPPPAPEPPPFQLGPTDYANRLQGSPTNWLQSYYDRNFAQQGWPQPMVPIRPHRTVLPGKNCPSGGQDGAPFAHDHL
jgi:hypothetical protein